MKLGWLLLTMGDRARQLAGAISSIRALDDQGEVTVVYNGCEPDPASNAENAVVLPENIGVAAGRNAGWAESNADVVCFLDDDAAIGEGFDLGSLADMFRQDAELAVVSFRIVDPKSGLTARRHVPRLGGSRAEQEFEATSFLGGACAIRRSVLEELGGYWGELFYSHEETEFSWRAIDAGYRIVYAPQFVVSHDAADPRSRHPQATYLSMRNRVLISKRDLPLPLRVVYPTVWVILTFLRCRSKEELRSLRRGFRDGVGTAVDRNPIRWSTVWRLARLGRPPII